MRVAKITALLLGLFLLCNGLVMLVDPQRWYATVPGVVTTGPFNQHFLRDIGLIYVMIGGGFLAGIRRPRDRPLLWTAATLWLAGHALFHVWEVAVGICGSAALWRDFPGVTVPALIGAVLAAHAWYDRRVAGSPRA